jgi:hypothetical protein
MINIDNIIKEFVEKKWSGKVIQIPRIWLTSVGSGLFYEVEGEITKHTEQAASIYHKPSSEHSSEEPDHTDSATTWYFGLQISKDEGEVVGYWIKDKKDKT